MIGQLFTPWRTVATWWAFVFCVTSLFIGGFTFVIVVTAVSTAISMIVLFPIAAIIMWILFFVVDFGAHIERTRISALLGKDLVNPVPKLTKANWFLRQLERFTSLARWRQVAYFLLLLPLGLLTGVTVITAWVTGALALTLPLYIGRLPQGFVEVNDSGIRPGLGAWVTSLVGLVVLVFIAPWLTTAMGALSAALGRWMLGTETAEELEHAVVVLEASRSAAVDSAESERKRIERDLHDGAQQRLVAIAIDLGIARERTDLTADEGKAVISKAHDEIKAAMKDLRDLIRGIHPVVLEDRGLDAALSGVVARSTMPISLAIDVPSRLSSEVESAAYFVVSESLTNVARHSQATSASVSLVARGNRLVIEVSDNGVGGADASRGTGLHGLRVRVEALGGWMTVVSPVGGPTSIIVEMPCAS